MARANTVRKSDLRERLVLEYNARDFGLESDFQWCEFDQFCTVNERLIFFLAKQVFNVNIYDRVEVLAEAQAAYHETLRQMNIWKKARFSSIYGNYLIKRLYNMKRCDMAMTAPDSTVFPSAKSSKIKTCFDEIVINNTMAASIPDSPQADVTVQKNEYNSGRPTITAFIPSQNPFHVCIESFQGRVSDKLSRAFALILDKKKKQKEKTLSSMFGCLPTVDLAEIIKTQVRQEISGCEAKLYIGVCHNGGEKRVVVLADSREQAGGYLAAYGDVDMNDITELSL